MGLVVDLAWLGVGWGDEVGTVVVLVVTVAVVATVATVGLPVSVRLLAADESGPTYVRVAGERAWAVHGVCERNRLQSAKTKGREFPASPPVAQHPPPPPHSQRCPSSCTSISSWADRSPVTSKAHRQNYTRMSRTRISPGLSERGIYAGDPPTQSSPSCWFAYIFWGRVYVHER